MSTWANKLICYWHPNLIALYGRWALKELLLDFPPRNFLKRRFCPKVHKLTSSSFAKVERSDVVGYAERVMLHIPSAKTRHRPWPSGFHLKSICQHWNLQFCQICMQFLHQAMKSTLALRLSSNSFLSESPEVCLFAGPDFELSALLPSSRGEVETANARITVQPPAPMNLPLRGVKPEVDFREVRLFARFFL